MGNNSSQQNIAAYLTFLPDLTLQDNLTENMEKTILQY